MGYAMESVRRGGRSK